MMKRFAIVGLSIFMSLFLVEYGLLRWVDPWGANAYYNDLDTLKTHYVADSERGYTLPTGIYQLGHWSLTITSTGRLVPDTTPDNPIIALVGDSLTMGHGVNDSDTFANQLARRFPNCTFRDYGLNGYNTAQVQATIDNTIAAHYVYTLVSNDAEPALTIDQMYTAGDDFWAGLHRYWYHWLKTRPRGNVALAESNDTLPFWFIQSYTAVSSRDDVLIVGFAGEQLAEQMAAMDTNIQLIPHYTHSISYADPHPSSEGHQQITNALEPYVAQWCGGES